MATRTSALQRALNYFRSADVDEVRVAFTLAKEIVERRLAQSLGGGQAASGIKAKRTRKPRVQATAPTNGSETLADA